MSNHKPEEYALIKSFGEKSLMTTTEFWEIMKGTVVPKGFTDAQVMVFLSVAHSLGLNPLNGEVYPALLDGRVAALVSIDGWLKRANIHPQMDGLTVEYSDDYQSCTVTIYRKDRSYPTAITEFLDECRKNTGPWNSHEKRMLRHRAIIQCVRVAFGSGGAVDSDDREYFPVDGQVMDTPQETKSRIDGLNEVIGEAVGEPEPVAFTSVPKTTCGFDGCNKRLIRLCEACGVHFCPEHFDHGAGLCTGCVAPPEETGVDGAVPDPNEGVSTEVEQDKYPANKGKDAMPNRGKMHPEEDPEEDLGPELPWE